VLVDGPTATFEETANAVINPNVGVSLLPTEAPALAIYYAESERIPRRYDRPEDRLLRAEVVLRKVPFPQEDVVLAEGGEPEWSAQIASPADVEHIALGHAGRYRQAEKLSESGRDG
jgi:hypothetical protein